jgi:prefoldin subunit 5
MDVTKIIEDTVVKALIKLQEEINELKEQVDSLQRRLDFLEKTN